MIGEADEGTTSSRLFIKITVEGPRGYIIGGLWLTPHFIITTPQHIHHNKTNFKKTQCAGGELDVRVARADDSREQEPVSSAGTCHPNTASARAPEAPPAAGSREGVVH